MNYSYLIITWSLFCDQALSIYRVIYNKYHNDLFIIKTEGCSITDITEPRESIKAKSGPTEKENCRQQNQLLESNATHIWVLHDLLSNFNKIKENSLSCCYKNFTAIKNITNILYSDCQPFSKIIKAQHEFVNVDCYYEDSVIHSEYFAFSPSEARPKRRANKSTYNVIVLGLESLSRLNFERTMPKTAKFLKERGSIQLRGYNKVGYNSFPNLFPLLTGRSYDSCRNITCSFIWELFRNAGFYTALGSDSTVGAMGSYEYGWPAIPTDYYLQPFMAATDNVIPDDVYRYERLCLGSKAFYKILLNYIQGLLRTLRHSNKLFGFFWEESVSHDELKKPQLMDEGYLNFMTALEINKYLDDTILIVSSDHGMRWGDFAKTRQGRLEAKLPLFSILLPTSFRKKYKNAYKNLQINSFRLVTPYDAYRTFVDLVNPNLLENHHLKVRMKAKELLNRPSSLFLPVPGNRTCPSVGIEEAWCACDEGTEELTKNQEVAMAAATLLDKINKMVIKYPCRKLSLRKVFVNDDFKAVTYSGRTYTLAVEATPGGGLFGGMVRYQKRRWAAFGPITRLNRYTERTSCVNDALIKLYCFCI